MSIVLRVKERGIIRRNKSTVDARQLKLSRDRENSSNGAESLRYQSFFSETSKLGNGEFVLAIRNCGLRGIQLASPRSLDHSLWKTVRELYLYR